MKSFARTALLVSTAVVPLSVLPLGAAAYAQTATRNYSIAAQDLGDALRQFATQSGRDVAFDPAIAQGKTSKAVQGTMSDEAALRRLTEGSGLNFKTTSNGFAVTAKNGEGLAEGEAGSDTAAISEILVVGSRSRNVDIKRTRDDIQPYTVLTRDVIERSGASNVDDLLRQQLPANVSRFSANQSEGVVGNVSRIDLRGLGQDETLILIDGRRAGAYALQGSTGQPDINSIPLSAIERIDVLPLSASAIYGGGATGGVVNVVLRHDYKGLELTAKYEHPLDGHASEKRFDLAGGFGFNGGRTSIFFYGSIADADPLLAGDREDLYRRGVNTILMNSPATLLAGTPPIGYTTNIRSLTGAPLTLRNGGGSLGSNIAYVPVGYAGFLSDGGQAFLGTAGTYNFDFANTAQLGGRKYFLTSKDNNKSFNLSLRHEFSQVISAYADLSWSRTETGFASNQLNSLFVISPAAPNNPFNETVIVQTPTFGADQQSSSVIQKKSVLVGGLAKLPWKDWSVALEHSVQWVKTSNDIAAFGITAAGTNAVTSGQIDVFRDTSISRPDFSQYGMGQQATAPVRARTDLTTLNSGGHVVSLPGGNVDLALKLERQLQALGEYRITQPFGISGFPKRSQENWSAYGELRIPIFSKENEVKLIKALEIQLSGRLDLYKLDTSTVYNIINGNLLSPILRDKALFTAFSPLAGVRFSPVSGLMFRASYSEGFLPPGLTQIVELAPLVRSTGLFGVVDPLRGNEPVNYSLTVRRGGNPDLRPETSKSKTVGVILTPTFVPNFRFSIDWASIEKSNNIAILGATQATLVNEPYIPGIVERGPPLNDGFSVGRITRIDGRFLNLQSARYKALDIAIDYSLKTLGYGEFSVSAKATRNITNSSKASPTAPTIESAGQSSVPEWAASGSLTWEYKNLMINWNTQFLGAYWYRLDHTFFAPAGAKKSDSAFFHDAQVRYVFDKGLPKVASRVEVAAGIKNIFNKKPRLDFSNGNTYADPRTDIFLRSAYISLKSAF